MRVAGLKEPHVLEIARAGGRVWERGIDGYWLLACVEKLIAFISALGKGHCSPWPGLAWA
jgi:hypothetical protein